MKRLSFFGIVALLAWACSTAKVTSKPQVSLTGNEKDSTSYEILVIDPGFDTWYSLNYSPALDHNNEYYRVKNNLGVMNWNNYFTSGLYSKVIDSHIVYWPETDYGIEVNRKLYWYFRYIETTYRVPLMSQ